MNAILVRNGKAVSERMSFPNGWRPLSGDQIWGNTLYRVINVTWHPPRNSSSETDWMLHINVEYVEDQVMS